MPDAMYYSEIPTVPHDSEILSVHFNDCTRTLDVTIRHPSFDVVGLGEMIPRFPARGATNRVIKKKDYAPPQEAVGYEETQATQ